jgi:Rrf2 family transcriptional regulator, iron-sulfur cluster assembly transcription factor
MKITANEEYGLRIMIRMAKILANEDSRLVSLNEIADAEGISAENTAAILSKLREAGLIESVRGKYGGYNLAHKAQDINLYQIISSLSKDTFSIDFCETHAGKQDVCVHSNDCSVRSVWSNLTNLINNFLGSISLQYLLDDETKAQKGIRNSFSILQDFTEANLMQKASKK